MTAILERSEPTRRSSELVSLEFDLHSNIGLQDIAGRISTTPVNFDYYSDVIAGMDAPPYDPGRIQGLLGEMHVATVLEQATVDYGPLLDLESVPLQTGTLFVKRGPLGNLDVFDANTHENPFEIDGVLKIDGLVVPYEVKTGSEKSALRAMKPARINIVGSYMEELFPGSQLGYMVIAPPEAFDPPWRGKADTRETGTAKFRRQRGVTAALPESHAVFHRTAQTIFDRLNPTSLRHQPSA